MRLFVAVTVLAVPLLASAQAPGTTGRSAATRNASRSVPAAAEKTVTLPLRQVALYKNGIGYFEQSGQVSGDAFIRIDASTEQLNDVLDSLTATDLGNGHIAGAGFHTAESFRQELDALHLGPDPTVLDLLHAIRGARVEVRSPAGSVTGKVLNVDVRTEPVPGTRSRSRYQQPDPRPADGIERRYLSLVTASGGLRALELTPATEVRLLDTPQRDEIGRYLQVLATSHTPALRHLTLEDRGTGDREVRVDYINAMPAWKSSYRILFGAAPPAGSPLSSTAPSNTARVQGWAVIDNTSSVAWKEVQLILVSGAAASFTQQISRPEYIQRPELGLLGGVGSRP